MPDESVVLLFMKAPVRGQVKSRLAATVGEETALKLYTCFILDTIDMLKTTEFPVRICYYSPGAEDTISSWLDGSHQIMKQEGKDLGERMELAFKRVFSEGVNTAVLIGSDLPDLPALTIKKAFEMLKTNDSVIGPAADGGYYLIGLNKKTFTPGIFHVKKWSTSSVFQETMDILNRTSHRVYLMPPWHDVDTLEDLRSFVERNKGSLGSGSRTLMYLREKNIGRKGQVFPRRSIP